jgi:hypothetical protein
MISETFFDALQEIERSQTAPVFALCYEGMEEWIDRVKGTMRR